jgi:hypothetical protein
MSRYISFTKLKHLIFPNGGSKSDPRGLIRWHSMLVHAKSYITQTCLYTAKSHTTQTCSRTLLHDSHLYMGYQLPTENPVHEYKMFWSAKIAYPNVLYYGPEVIYNPDPTTHHSWAERTIWGTTASSVRTVDGAVHAALRILHQVFWAREVASQSCVHNRD